MRVFLEFIFGTLLALCSAELTLYLVGYSNNSASSDYLPGSWTTDPVRGWKHKPGVYLYIDPTSSAPMKVTYWSDTSRATQEKEDLANPTVLMLGCSFMEGFGLSDEQTLAWKLQQRSPELTIKNFGNGGYGALHSLLAEKEYFARHPDNPPKVIVYGFASFHPVRSIKNPLAQRHWKAPGIFPYCDMQRCGTWEGKSMAGFLHHSRVFSLLENAWDSFILFLRKDEAEQITLNLVKEMNELALSHHSRFVVVPLHDSNSKWLERFKQIGVPVFDCDSTELQSASYRLLDGHPNEPWSEKFAECIRHGLSGLVHTEASEDAASVSPR